MKHEYTGLSITRFWGRNSAPFPMQKSMFFSQFQTKNSQFDKKKFFFFFFLSLFHIIQIQNILYYIIYQEKKVSLIIGINLAMETSFDNVKFPNFSQNAANFPNSIGPGPIPKKGCESPDINRLHVHNAYLLHILRVSQLRYPTVVIALWYILLTYYLTCN